MKFSPQTNVENFIDDLFSQGIIALNHCCTESGEKDINHYELLESGQEISNDCFDEGRIPLTTEEGKNIISEYLNNKSIVLHYPSKLSAINFETVRKYKNTIIIEGTVADVLSFKDQVTDSQGNFNPFDLFESLIDKELVSKRMTPKNPDIKLKYKKDVQRENHTFSTEKGSKYREKFESYWSQSIQGAGGKSKKDHFQLVIGYDSEYIPANEWYGTSLRFPNLMFLLKTYHVNDLYDGTFLFQNGEMYYKTSYSYFRDSNGYSICLDKNMTWIYVMHPEAKMQNKARKYVDPGQVIPLEHQMIKIDNPASFCRYFPYELFISWYIDEDNYFLPRPNTVFHPDMLPSAETEPVDDFDM
jgi:hypothetical protein